MTREAVHVPKGECRNCKRWTPVNADRLCFHCWDRNQPGGEARWLSRETQSARHRKDAA